MTKKIWLLSLGLIFFISTQLFSDSNEFIQKIEKAEKPTFQEIQENMNAYFMTFPSGKKPGYKQYKRWEWYWSTRLDKNGYPGLSEWLNSAYSLSMTNKKTMPSLQGYDWKLIGPKTTPEMVVSTGLGRINSIELHPNDPNTLLIGAAGGGIWRTIDNGKNWVNLYPSNSFNTNGITDICYSSSNPNIIYAATGDAFGANASGYSSYSVGIIKSTDNGNSWKVTGLNTVLASYFKIAVVKVHPNDPNIVVAATRDGIYKTTDGGDSWTKTSASVEFYDIEINPSEPNIIYASTLQSNNSTVYKSTNFGTDWKLVKNFGSGTKRTQLGVSANDPNYLYALVSHNNEGFHSFWVSEDKGDTWVVSNKISTDNLNILGWDENGANKPGGMGTYGQAWYDLALAVSPKDEYKIFTGGINVWNSEDGGSSFTIKSFFRTYSDVSYMHADQHDMVFSHSGDKLYVANDGGIYYTTDFKKWNDITNGLPITQFYRFSSNPADTSMLLAGAQDNATMKKKNTKWNIIYDGDGADCKINPKYPQYWYYSYVNGEFKRSVNYGENESDMVAPSEFPGQNAAWVAPICVDPENTNNVYVGFSDILKSSTYGKQGSFSIISSTTGNKSEITTFDVYGDHIYFTNRSSTLWGTYDGGTTWFRINGITADWNSPITGISIDQNNPKRFFVTIGGFDGKNKVYEVNDKVAKNITGNLPNIPINCILHHKNSPDRLYIGTDIGVYMSDYNSSYWERYGDDLPNVIVTDIEILEASKLLRVSTYGRGLWQAPLTDCNLKSPEIEALSEVSFCKGGSVTLKVKGDYQEYNWSNGMTTKEITVTESGTYTFIYKEGNCTSKSNSIEVTVYDIPELSIFAVNELAFCEDQNTEVKIQASSNFKTYKWSTGETTPEITITKPGKYSVEASTANDCKATATIEVKAAPRPTKPEIWKYQNIIGSTVVAERYQWYKDGKKILNGGQGDKLVMNTSNDNFHGKYKVEIWDANGCQNISEEIDVVDIVADLKTGEFININPNPVDEVMNLDIALKANGTFNLIIFDLNGRELYSTQYFSLYGFINDRINMSKFENGVYLLQIENNGTMWREKIIKK